MTEELIPDNIFPDTDDNAQRLMAGLMVEFVFNFPPGAIDDHEQDKSMSAEEVFMLINNHVPDIATHYEVAALLFKCGYISRYDRTSHEFKWLIKYSCVTYSSPTDHGGAFFVLSQFVPACHICFKYFHQWQ